MALGGVETCLGRLIRLFLGDSLSSGLALSAGRLDACRPVSGHWKARWELGRSWVLRGLEAPSKGDHRKQPRRLLTRLRTGTLAGPWSFAAVR